MTTENVINEIAAEASRQFAPPTQGGEGYSAEHDDRHSDGAELAKAGAAYALLAARWTPTEVDPIWPWPEPIKPKSPRRDLVVACADQKAGLFGADYRGEDGERWLYIVCPDCGSHVKTRPGDANDLRHRIPLSGAEGTTEGASPRP